MRAILQLRRLVAPLTIAILIGGAAFTYQAKHEAVQAAEEVAQLRLEIGQEQIRLSLLKAEWSELTQPGRIQDLIGRYPDVLTLAPFGIERMVAITDIPFSPRHDFIAEMVAHADRPEAPR